MFTAWQWQGNEFRERISSQDVSLSACFFDYNGAAGDADASLSFITRKFMDLNTVTHIKQYYPLGA